MHTLQNILISL